jgi:hypothetical protein
MHLRGVMGGFRFYYSSGVFLGGFFLFGGFWGVTWGRTTVFDCIQGGVLGGVRGESLSFGKKLPAQFAV